MAEQKRKERGPWDRFMIWVRANQRVIWVGLLILVAPTFAFVSPVQDLFAPSSEKFVVDRIFGKAVTQLDAKRTIETVIPVLSLVGRSRLVGDDPLPGALGSPSLITLNLTLRREDFVSALDFHALKERALRLGLRVSDLELGTCVQELWRRNRALDLAAFEVASTSPPNDASSQWQRQFEIREKSKEKLEQLRSTPFDVQSWSEMLRTDARTRVPVLDFEDTLRDVILIAKLEEYVKSSRNVTPQEVYESYAKEMERRKVSWVEFKLGEDLKSKISGTLTPEQVKLHYEKNKDDFRKPPSVRVKWLLLPKEHFKELASKNIAEADLVTYHRDHRNDYRRPTVLGEEATFALRSAEEKTALEQKLFMTLEEVKDKVREKAVEEKAAKDIEDFGDKLRLRLFPREPGGDAKRTLGDKPAATFEDLVKESSFLKMGATGWTSREDAKGVLGDAYTFQVDQWFTSAEKTKSKPKAPEYPARGEAGMVFYQKLEYRDAAIPVLSEIENEVRDSLVKEEGLNLLEKAARELSKELNDGKKDLSALQDPGIALEVAGEKVPVKAEPLGVSSSFVGREGPLMVPKPKVGAEKSKEEAKETEPGTEDEEDAEEAHSASREILTACFALSGKGKTGIAVSGRKRAARMAGPDKESGVFLVRYDEAVAPDPGGFEKEWKELKSRLLSERQFTYFNNWLLELRREARGRSPAEETASSTAEAPAS